MCYVKYSYFLIDILNIAKHYHLSTSDKKLLLKKYLNNAEHCSYLSNVRIKWFP